MVKYIKASGTDSNEYVKQCIEAEKKLHTVCQNIAKIYGNLCIDTGNYTEYSYRCPEYPDNSITLDSPCPNDQDYYRTTIWLNVVDEDFIAIYYYDDGSRVYHMYEDGGVTYDIQLGSLEEIVDECSEWFYTKFMANHLNLKQELDCMLRLCKDVKTDIEG